MGVEKAVGAMLRLEDAATQAQHRAAPGRPV